MPYMWNLKRNSTKKLRKQKETHRLRKQAYGYPREVIVRDSGKVMYTPLFVNG